MTQGERLARIETLLEESIARELCGLRRDVTDLRGEVKEIRADLERDKADLATLKNRGVGILIGVSLAAGSLGAAASQLWEQIR